MNFLIRGLVNLNNAVSRAILILVIDILHDAQFGDLSMYYNWYLFSTKILRVCKNNRYMMMHCVLIIFLHIFILLVFLVFFIVCF